MEKERKIDLDKKHGTCPYCDSDNYSRENLEPVEDYILLDCHCNDCDKDFRETFRLDFQNWESD